MSNWQEELAESYTDGVDLALYDSIPDAVEKAAFYLAHQEIRERITRSGMEKTLSEHDLKDVLTKIFQTADII